MMYGNVCIAFGVYVQAIARLHWNVGSQARRCTHRSTCTCNIMHNPRSKHQHVLCCNLVVTRTLANTTYLRIVYTYHNTPAMLSHARRLLCTAIARRAARGLGDHHVLTINPASCLHSVFQPLSLQQFSTINTLLAQHTAKRGSLGALPLDTRSIWTSAAYHASAPHPRAQAQQRKSSEQGLYLVHNQ